MHISVVIPVYGCKACLKELHQRLAVSLAAITPDYEIILVNDGCPQHSWETVREIALRDRRVVGIDLARNFGQIRAITAGLDCAQGDWVVVMDCDLQDRPEEIGRLYSKALEGYDVVFSRRTRRKDTLPKRLASWLFYKVYGYFTGGAFDGTICNFSISRNYVIANYIRMREQNRAFVLFIRWMGFKWTAIEVDHAERASGKSSYNLSRQFRLAFEIITAHSNKPLILSIKAGCLIALASFTWGSVLIFRKLAHGIAVPGWTTVVVSLFFLGGLVLTNLGILGLYIGYIFDQVKDRPLYLIRETVIDGDIRFGGDLG